MVARVSRGLRCGWWPRGGRSAVGGTQGSSASATTAWGAEHCTHRLSPSRRREARRRAGGGCCASWGRRPGRAGPACAGTTSPRGSTQNRTLCSGASAPGSSGWTSPAPRRHRRRWGCCCAGQCWRSRCAQAPSPASAGAPGDPVLSDPWLRPLLDAAMRRWLPEGRLRDKIAACGWRVSWSSGVSLSALFWWPISALRRVRKGVAAP